MKILTGKIAPPVSADTVRVSPAPKFSSARPIKIQKRDPSDPGSHLTIDSVYCGCISLMPQKESKTMYKRINITLPESSVRLMESVAGKGDRSRLVDEALKQYLRRAPRKSLKKKINEGSVRRFERDRAIVSGFGSERTEAKSRRLLFSMKRF
jgi:CopG family transcriptional regulator/antitoxin EndoAI